MFEHDVYNYKLITLWKYRSISHLHHPLSFQNKKFVFFFLSYHTILKPNFSVQFFVYFKMLYMSSIKCKIVKLIQSLEIHSFEPARTLTQFNAQRELHYLQQHVKTVFQIVFQ